jgi:hypothetical protein
MWRTEDVSFVLIDDQTSDPVVTVEITVPGGRLSAMAEPTVVEGTLILRAFHMHGEGIGAERVGTGNLLALAGVVLEGMGFDELVVEGADRTTGAKPGRRPRPLRFTRRVRPEPGAEPG